VHIFNNLLRRQIGSRWPTVEYLCKRGDVVFETLKGYENEDIALNTGMILKEMLRHESLCKLLLWSDQCVQVAYPDPSADLRVAQILLLPSLH
jgi:calcium binding protein 39